MEMIRFSLAALVLILLTGRCTVSSTPEAVTLTVTPATPTVASATATPAPVPTATPTHTPTPTSTYTPIPALTPIGEVGHITDTLTNVRQTVELSRHYANPVVFAQPPSRDGDDTAVIRIADVQADRFVLHVHDAPGQTAGHGTESVSYVVLEAGSWELPDQTLLEVGKLSTDATVGRAVPSTWERVSFGLSFSAAPLVISQVQTEDSRRWAKTRQSNVTAAGFDVALEQQENMETPQGSETIGWLAIETGHGDWNGHAFEASQTPSEVTHEWYQIAFGQSFGQAPRFVAMIVTANEGDSSHLRYDRNSLTAGGVSIMIEEDTTWDSEIDHLPEVVGYLAWEGDGVLVGREVPR